MASQSLPRPGSLGSPVAPSAELSANNSRSSFAAAPGQSPVVSLPRTPAPPPKQLRFVANDGLPHPKRRRISAACRTCRKRKIRCSGEQPVCKTCSENNHDCLGYAEPPAHHRTGSNDRLESSLLYRDSLDKPSYHPPASTYAGALSINEVLADASEQDAGKQPDQARSSFSSVAESPKQTQSKPEKELESPVDLKSPASSNQSMAVRNRVPYFRYFGPTAIVPGFKQMFVQVREQQKRVHPVESPTSVFSGAQSVPTPSGLDKTPSSIGDVDLPFYDASTMAPNHTLISHLCETFFIHLGCNFPFLQRERFMRDLEAKNLEAALVDVVCAMGARFSTHPLLVPSSAQRTSDAEPHRAAYGQPYATRAMSAVVDSFSYPTLEMVQASLLLAYQEFGINHDSGLWMYLGISIRMAQDLGMQKLEGLRHAYGRLGPTPKTIKSGPNGIYEEKRREEEYEDFKKLRSTSDAEILESQITGEKERIDTFWCVFFLDRVISSGTGRPVTLRDKDIEVSFPRQVEESDPNDWPLPFPPLIRIIHLYGRVTDLLNSIKSIHNVTPELMKKLAGMESDLTGIYQRLSPKLHFNATNFQHHVKAGHGTNFILLHFWFHTLIVLLHQPTLLHSFEGRIQQLFSNSRELSMSSAKTIADILSFAELLDAKSFIGNPFTSQPMYIAACAFLVESAIHSNSNSSSRSISPTRTHESLSRQRNNAPGTKHSLLASAATQNYQRCYKCLKALESYWAGTKYILTVLDQKAKGIFDPLLYTSEEMDSAVEAPHPEPVFKSPGWRRSVISERSPSIPAQSASRIDPYDPASPMIDPSQVLGFSLTGSGNSSNPNLSFLYQTPNGESTELDFFALPQQHPGAERMTETSRFDSKQNLPQGTGHASRSIHASPQQHQAHTQFGSNIYQRHPQTNDPISTSDADLLLGLHAPYSTINISRSESFGIEAPALTPSAAQSSLRTSATTASTNADTEHQAWGNLPKLNATQSVHHASLRHQGLHQPHNHGSKNRNPGYQSFIPLPSASPYLTPMLNIESQDIDLTSAGNLQQGQNGGLPLPFLSGGEFVPWLEYLPQDVLNLFEDVGMSGIEEKGAENDHGEGLVHPHEDAGTSGGPE